MKFNMKTKWISNQNELKIGKRRTHGSTEETFKNKRSDTYIECFFEKLAEEDKLLENYVFRKDKQARKLQ